MNTCQPRSNLPEVNSPIGRRQAADEFRKIVRISDVVSSMTQDDDSMLQHQSTTQITGGRAPSSDLAESLEQEIPQSAWGKRKASLPVDPTLSTTPKVSKGNAQAESGEGSP